MRQGSCSCLDSGRSLRPVLSATTGEERPEVSPVLAAADLVSAQRLVRQVHFATALYEYVNRLVREVKAVTYHGVRVEREGVWWTARVVLDV